MSDSSYPGAASSSASNCPTCGTALPSDARYCPNCGTRVQQGASYDPDAFRTAVDDVLDDREHGGGATPESPANSNDVDTIQIPTTRSTPPFDEAFPAPDWEPVTVSPTPPPIETAPPTWTATPSDWTIQTPSTSGATSPRKRENRTLWIILAIFGGIVFCCCALFFLLFAVSSADSSFQSEISLVAALM